MTNYYCHATAIIDKGATIGAGTKIWHWAHICAGSKIGQNWNFGQNVFISNKVVIGNNVKVQNNVSIYDNVEIEDDVFCGPSMVFTNVINPRSAISRKTEYKKTIVKKGASLGANCTIICGNIIGNFAFIGAGAVVTTNVKPFSLMIGVPAKHVAWISERGDKLDLPLEGAGKTRCEHSGQEYRLLNGNIERI